MNAFAIRVHQNGGPEQLAYEPINVPAPKQGEVQIRHTAIGLNFIDIYFRTGLYPSPSGFPFIPGNEAAGVVTACGEGVDAFEIGDRVAYASTMGAYCTDRNIAADRIVHIPDGVSDQTAAAMMLKGMTAEYLLHRTFKVEKQHVILIHAAAGGVGLIAGQWAAFLGAKVIGTAGSAEKAALAKANGYSEVIDYKRENFVERVKDITGGAGVDVVYDSVGKDTWVGSLDCLKPRGMFVTFGQSSGAIEGFTLGHLASRGSLFATRPSLFAYTSSRSDLELSSGRLFDVVKSGAVKIAVNQTFALKDAGKTHETLEGRGTTGATVLIP
ncbi:MAG: quinone oxidoreductase family protein [Rhizobiaceae bacterium]